MKPNFIVIGAARSGTTSLFQYLDHHPQVVMSQVKELNFFSNDKYWRKGFKWYERRFPSAKESSIAVGEASTSYTQSPFSPPVPERIYNYNPNMKLIYVVRDPIERFVSHYLQRVKAGHETRDFDDVFGDLENEAFAWQGRYYHQLCSYLDYFDESQIKVISFDEIKKDPYKIISDLFLFLGVRDDVAIDGLDRVHNAGSKVIKKSRIGLKVINFYHEHIEQRNMPYRFKKIFIEAANFSGTVIVKPNISFWQKELLTEFYRDDSFALKERFGVKTDDWKCC